VQKAASILEEEIAIGILAAKEIEQKFVDVPGIRSAAPEEVVVRFRKDAHEIVDILMDLVALGTKSVATLTESLVRLEPKDQSIKSAAGSSGIPTLVVPGVVAPGQLASISMSLENAADKETEEIELHASDLVSAEGHRIESGLVQFSPKDLTLGSNSTQQVSISITVPEATPEGAYAGLIQATRMDHLRAVLVIHVKKQVS
jgi:hypothetical protein